MQPVDDASEMADIWMLIVEFLHREDRPPRQAGPGLKDGLAPLPEPIHVCYGEGE